MLKKVLTNLLCARRILDGGGNPQDALEYLKVASLTLKKLIKNEAEAGSDLSSLEEYRNDIMYCIGYSYLIMEPMEAENALRAFEKVEDKQYLDIAKGICLYEIGNSEHDREKILSAKKYLEKVISVAPDAIDDTCQQTIVFRAIGYLAEIHYYGQMDANGSYIIPKNHDRAHDFISVLEGIEAAKNIVQVLKENMPFEEKHEKVTPSKTNDEEIPKPAWKAPEIKPIIVKNKVSDKRKITIRRKTMNFSALGGSLIPFGVFVDGIKVGELELGNEITLEISKESHTLQVKMQNFINKIFNGGAESDLITIPSGNTEYIYVSEVVMHDGFNEVVLAEQSRRNSEGSEILFNAKESETINHVANVFTVLLSPDGQFFEYFKAGASTMKLRLYRDSILIEWEGKASMSSRFYWRKLTNEFAFIENKSDRDEVLQIFHEKILELPYMEGTPGLYTINFHKLKTLMG